MASACDMLIRSQMDLRDRIRRALAKLHHAGDECYNETMIETRISLLDQNWQHFQGNHQELIAQHWDEISKRDYHTLDIFNLAEEDYIQQRSGLTELLLKLRKEKTESVAKPASSVARSQPKRIIKFSGRFRDWEAFRNTFRTTILEDESLSEPQKIELLDDSLSGEALKIFDNTLAIGGNLQSVWTKLNDYFGNLQTQVRNSVTIFLNLPVVRSGSETQLRGLLREVTETRNFLKRLERDVEKNDFFIHAVISKMNPSLFQSWRAVRANCQRPPNLEEVLSFLQEKFEEMQRSSGNLTATKGPAGVQELHGSQTLRSGNLVQISGKKPSKCSLCLGAHYILACGALAKMGPQARMQLVQKSELCINCFGEHDVAACPSTRFCSECGNRHHTSVHDAFLENRSKTTTPRSSPASPIAISSWAEECSNHPDIEVETILPAGSERTLSRASRKTSGRTTPEDLRTNFEKAAL